jgi:DNA primase catalytic core
MAVAPTVVAELNALAAARYEELLWSPAGSAALAYARSRGLSDRAIRHWRLGFAPADGRTLLRELGREGWGEPTLIEAGLVRPGERGASDLLRDRLVLPIIDRDGTRVLAFGSRRLRDDDPKVPKYLNSPETPLFRKGETLFGLPNLGAIERAGEAFVVEGNLDAIALWDAGVENVVAAAGTAFTAEHLAVLRAAVGKITLVLDADAAGQAATVRSLLLPGADRAGLGVVEMTGGKDPAELIGAGGRAAWDTLVGGGRADRWEHLWRAIERRHPERISDVEAAIAWKDDWVALVREHGGDPLTARGLLGRLASALELPAPLLAKEYLADLAPEPLVDAGDASTEELLLLALAADWGRRAPLVGYLPLGKAAQAELTRWRKAGSPALGPRLARLVEPEGAAAEDRFSLELRRARPRIAARYAELTRRSIGDPESDEGREAAALGAFLRGD